MINNTTTGINFLNSMEVSKMLGVNVSTIKRWTDDGSLSCNKTVGGHRKFFMAHLVDFIERNNINNPKVEVFSLEDEIDLNISYNVVKRNYDELINYLVNYAFTGNRDRVKRILNGLYMSQVPLYAIFDNLITPSMNKVGDLWDGLYSGIIEEHIATQTIRDSIIRLQGIIKLNKEIIGKALLLNPSGELHDLSLKMIDHILEERGFSNVYAGQNTPMITIESIFKEYNPDRIYISSTYSENKNHLQHKFDHLLEISKYFNFKIYVGGSSFDYIKIPDSLNAIRLYSYKDVMDK